MHLIDPTKNNDGNNGGITRDEQQRRHYKSIKANAIELLKKCHNDVELRSAIINLYHQKIRDHMVEITAHPERSVNYLMACLEVFQVCLQHIFTTIQQQEQDANEMINDTIDDNNTVQDEKGVDDNETR